MERGIIIYETPTRKIPSGFRMAQTVIYKGFAIQGRALPDLESGEWTAEAVVKRAQPAGSSEQRLPDPDDRSFASRADAEGYAINLAMRWVDRQT